MNHIIEETLRKSAGKLKTDIVLREKLKLLTMHLSSDMVDHFIISVELECERAIAIKYMLADISLYGWLKPPMSCRE